MKPSSAHPYTLRPSRGGRGASISLFTALQTHCLLLQIISPRNHMVFTPLLASSCVGTVESRSVTVPIVDVQKALRNPQVRCAVLRCAAWQGSRGARVCG